MNKPENRKNAREVALSVLMQISSNNAWSDGSLKREISINKLDSRDAALASRIAYGVLQNSRFLDYYISLWCTQKAHKLEPVVLNVLRIGAYQIIFMDKIPSRAAVNETVELIKKAGRPKASGMVNAVLRKFVVNKDNLPIVEAKNDVEKLSIKYSHPIWLINKISSEIGIKDTEHFLSSNNQIAETVIHVNPLKTSIEQLKDKLLLRDIKVINNEYLSNSLIISGFGDLESLPEFVAGEFWVQDTAAYFVSLAANAKKDNSILDVCSAPGGKSFSIAASCADQCSIISCDVHEHKMKLISNGAKRLGFKSITPFLADGRVYNSAWDEKFDIVIVDAPCSGLGIIRKKPDIRLKKAKDIEQLPSLQAEIINNASKYVKNGGTLIYSTCTVLSAENDNIANSFLQSHKEFSLSEFKLPKIGVCKGQITLWPHLHSTDGFYICKMTKDESKN